MSPSGEGRRERGEAGSGRFVARQPVANIVVAV